MPHLLLVASLALAAAPSVKVTPGDDPRQVRVEAALPPELAKGLPAGSLTQEQGEARLEFSLLDEDGKPVTAMLGRYEHRDGKLVFTPRHALVAGQRYRATLRLGGKKTLTADHAVPAKKAAATTQVEKVYPTADTLPANLLKFYVYFSRPMRKSRTIFDHFRLFDDKGKEIVDPWRRTELWDAEGKRLTIWIHPGRIKKGVNLREELGPILEPDRSYTLEVETKLLDEDGQPLAKKFAKKFRTTKALRSFVLAEDWTLAAPKAGTRDAMKLDFPRPLDHALLPRFVRVVDSAGKPVAGTFAVGKEEKSLAFVPEKPWKDEAHQVVVDGRLEDLAGNTPDALFDVNNEDPDPEVKPQKITFRPGKR